MKMIVVVLQITFELTMKQLLSLDPCKWTEGLKKEYVLVIDGFFSLPISIFSPTYRRAIKVIFNVSYYVRWFSSCFSLLHIVSSQIQSSSVSSF